MTNLAVALCKPLAASQTRLLFASLIALYPVLQKDFGAAFFNDINSTATKEDGEKSSNPEVLLPVNSMTWQEIARVAFLSDALGELGYTKQDSAHLLLMACKKQKRDRPWLSDLKFPPLLPATHPIGFFTCTQSRPLRPVQPVLYASTSRKL